MTAPIISAQALCKSYQDQAVVRNLDLRINAGQCFGLLGPNGAGKSTTIRMLLGLTPFDSGQLTILGHPAPSELAHAKHKIGVVPQDDNLDPDFSTVENLRIYGSYFGLKGQGLEQQVQQALTFVQLEDRQHMRVPQLSGGMRRRLTIARALINDPELIILDEPTTGLDPQVRHLIWSRLRELQNNGKTLLLTTHYMEEAERLCDEVAIIDHGQVIAQNTPKQLCTDHVEPQVFELPEPTPGLAAQLQTLGRLEYSGTSAYCYTHHAEQVLPLLQQQSQPWLHRPANLEDVFLRLTHRDLRQ